MRSGSGVDGDRSDGIVELIEDRPVRGVVLQGKRAERGRRGIDGKKIFPRRSRTSGYERKLEPQQMFIVELNEEPARRLRVGGHKVVLEAPQSP